VINQVLPSSIINLASLNSLLSFYSLGLDLDLSESNFITTLMLKDLNQSSIRMRGSLRWLNEKEDMGVSKMMLDFSKFSQKTLPYILLLNLIVIFHFLGLHHGHYSRLWS
jgi:hypothetical protein